MKTTLFILSMMIIGGSAIFSSCQQRTKKDLTKEPLIPVPASVTATNSSFVLDEGAMIYFDESSKDLKAVAEQLAILLRPATGYKLEVVPATAAPSEGIYLTIGAGEGDEGYELTITEDLVTISGAAPAGVFYGVQTSGSCCRRSSRLHPCSRGLGRSPRAPSRTAPNTTIEA